ncbi:MAG: winged helix-turn-helix transcriptional regulator [Paramuribaculum sp.]|nr:winged helix-turn-helix transcriptional regulator [Paramuribaculum sp.]
MLRHHIANLNQRVLQYQENDGVNVPNDGLNDGVKLLNKTLQRVYFEIVNKPEIRSVELMEILNISELTVTKATRELKKLGFIKRMGSDKTGKWQILK